MPNEIKVFASDLDGTLLPLADNQANRRDLTVLENFLWESGIQLVFVTGRPIASVYNAIESEDLPKPIAIIANVGTEIYCHDGHQFSPVHSYSGKLDEIAPADIFQKIENAVGADNALVQQEKEKQGRHKLSFYCHKSRIFEIARQWRDWLKVTALPISIVASEDSLSDQGFIDFLPSGVDKNFALRWWCASQQISTEKVLFAGDSGNDLAAMQSGMLSILVGNATDVLRNELINFHLTHFGDRSRVYFARGHATSGVLEGLNYYCDFDATA